MKKFMIIGLALTILAFAGLIGYGQLSKAQNQKSADVDQLIELGKIVNDSNSDVLIKVIDNLYPNGMLGGTIHTVMEDFPEGISVRGHDVISPQGEVSILSMDIVRTTSSACIFKNDWGTSTLDVVDVWVEINDKIVTSTTWRIGTTTAPNLSYAANNTTIMSDRVLPSSTFNMIQATTNRRIYWREGDYIAITASSTGKVCGDASCKPFDEQHSAFAPSSTLPAGKCYIKHTPHYFD